jgi:non-ribosomal peptide synthetase component F
LTVSKCLFKASKGYAISQNEKSSDCLHKQPMYFFIAVHYSAMETEYDFESLIQWFQYRVQLHPDRVAVVSRDESMTYGELDETSDKLAAMLCCLDVTRETLVVILMDRCLEFVVSYVAILKAGKNGCNYLIK